MKILSENVDSEYPQKIFEVGKVFSENLKEKDNLAAAFAPGNFTELKQVLEYLFRMLDKEVNLKEPSEFPQYFIEGRVAEILINSKKAGYIGEIHPKALKNWKLNMPVSVFEISLEEIYPK
jgi:phenylalanyl-tRNA synthetase beta chain